MKKIVLWSVSVLLGLGLAMSALAGEGKPQTTCPVMKGESINKNLYVDVQGKRISVCCRGCLADVQKNPEKYLKQLEAEGITPASIPAATAR